MEAQYSNSPPAKFHDHRSCGNRDITYLICRMNLQDQVMMRFCDIVAGASLLYTTVLPSLVAIVTVVVVIMFLIYYVDSRYYAFRGLRNFIASHSNHHLTRFGDHRLCCGRDVKDLIFHLTLQYNMIKGLYQFMKGNSSLYI